MSVNVGLPREMCWKGKLVTTAIFKEPVVGAVPVQGINIEGDLQADLRAHGGPAKAVYGYPAEHYDAWRTELGRDLPWGMFGENLTLSGLPLEDEIHIGDRYRAGTAELVVTQPRLPCYKLGQRFGDEGMVRRFLRSGRTGWYFAIASDGEVAAGDALTLVERASGGVPVSEVTRLYAHDRDDADGLRGVIASPALPADWREFFERRLTVALRGS